MKTDILVVTPSANWQTNVGPTRSLGLRTLRMLCFFGLPTCKPTAVTIRMASLSVGFGSPKSYRMPIAARAAGVLRVP